LKESKGAREEMFGARQKHENHMVQMSKKTRGPQGPKTTAGKRGGKKGTSLNEEKPKTTNKPWKWKVSHLGRVKKENRAEDPRLR